MCRWIRQGEWFCPKRFATVFGCKGATPWFWRSKGSVIELRPRKSAAQLRRVNGVLLLVSDVSVPTERELVAESREERIDEIIQADDQHRPRIVAP